MHKVLIKDHDLCSPGRTRSMQLFLMSFSTTLVHIHLLLFPLCFTFSEPNFLKNRRWLINHQFLSLQSHVHVYQFHLFRQFTTHHLIHVSSLKTYLFYKSFLTASHASSPVWLISQILFDHFPLFILHRFSVFVFSFLAFDSCFSY